MLLTSRVSAGQSLRNKNPLAQPKVHHLFFSVNSPAEDGIFGTSGGIGFTKVNELFVCRVAMIGSAIDGNYKQCSLVKRLKETKSQVAKSSTCINHLKISRTAPLHATMNSPRGFGPPPTKSKKAKKLKPGKQSDEEKDEEDEDDDEDDRERGVVPEIVTNRMISRMGFTVGLPLFIGLLFFPLFNYLKVGLKIDVPTWVPYIFSFVFFGTALAGVSYGIVSSSWDPLREGS